MTAPAPGPVRPSPATGTAGAAAPSGSGPQSDRHGAGAVFSAGRSCIRTEDGTVILFDRPTGRAVSALDRNTAEARLLHLAGGKSTQSGGGWSADSRLLKNNLTAARPPGGTLT
ncbi:hypothetical protein, partial [Mesorhizobium sp. M7A.F.Ca.CA.004.10.1.1]|uniref:hypothetical protein n=2 Tax=Phyllobacteriaceae TaxID=69277 RepID=UPI001FDF360E